MSGARTMLEQANDIGERLGPKPRRLARVAQRRFDDGLEQLDELGYSVQYRASDLPATPDVRIVKAAYQFDIARRVLRRMARCPDDLVWEGNDGRIEGSRDCLPQAPRS